MKKHLLLIFRDAVFYGSIGTASRLASLFVTPIVVRVFDAADYGVVDALRVLSVVLSGLALFALQQSAARTISIETYAEKKKEIAGQALMVAGLFTAIVMVVAAFLADRIALWIFDEARDDVVSAIHILNLAVPGSVCNAFALMLLRWNFRRRAYTICAVGGTISLLLITLVFVAYLDMGIKGVFYAQLLSSLFPIVMLAHTCREYIALKVEFAGWALVKFAFPLSLMTQAANIQPMIERIVILRLVGLEALGTFSVAQVAARAGRFPADSLYMAWYPYYSKIFREKSALSLELVLLGFYAALSVVYVLLAHFLSEPIIQIFAGSGYLGAAQLLAVVIAGYLFEVGASLVGIKVLLVGQSGQWAALYFLQGVAFIGFSVALAGTMGLMGIAYAFFWSRVLYFMGACIKSLLVRKEVLRIADAASQA